MSAWVTPVSPGMGFFRPPMLGLLPCSMEVVPAHRWVPSCKPHSPSTVAHGITHHLLARSMRGHVWEKETGTAIVF